MDRDVRLCVLALVRGVVAPEQFVASCVEATARGDTPVAHLLEERGLIRPGLLEQLESHERSRAAGREAPPATEPGREIPGPGTGFESTVRFLDSGSFAAPPNPSETVAFDESSPTRPREWPGPSRAVATNGQAGRHRRDRYRLEELHARGGIGQVWRATDTFIGREVALKELRPDRGFRDGPERFHSEARITARLQHPAIVPIYDLLPAEPGDAGFYTMRFVAGVTLQGASREYHARLATGTATPLDLTRLLNAFVTVCQAVDYAHARGVLHRDLKGQNVQLGEFGEVFVLDWGLARVAADAGLAPGPAVDPVGNGVETREGDVLGTAAYMAPEQAAGDHARVGPRTDVYGLGAILYEILAGRAPYTGRDSDEILALVRTSPPDRPGSLKPKVPRALEAICLRAMARRPEDRYASAGDLAREVQRWLADEPVEVHPDPLATRALRWARRHRTLVGSAAALLLTSVVALAIGAGLLAAETRKVEAALRQSEANLVVARGSVLTMLSTVSESELLNVPRADAVRARLADSAVEGVERLLKARPGDPALVREAGQLYRRAGNLFRTIHARRAAEDAYSKGIRLLEAAHAAQPEDVELRLSLAELRADLGSCEALLGRGPDALEQFAKALTLLDGAGVNELTRGGMLQVRAMVLAARRGVLEAAGRRDEADRDALEADRCIQDAYSLTNRPSWPVALLLAMVRARAGEALRRSGDAAAGDEALDEAVDVARRVSEWREQGGEDGTAASPEANGRFVWALALACRARAKGEVDPAAAGRDLDGAAGLLEPLLADRLLTLDQRDVLAGLYLDRGARALEEGRDHEAATHLGRARDLAGALIAEDPETPRLRARLGRAAALLARAARRRGDAASAESLRSEARDALNRALQGDPDDAEARTTLEGLDEPDPR